jgi:cytosine/adenosine deaminase-related metal-dependent hydrolase
MASPPALLLRARLVLPLRQPPIPDGAVLVRGDRIGAVGRWRDLAGRCPAAERWDLGERILMPGLVNAHCHLDYTEMAGLIAPTRHFTDWIKSITALKGQWSDAEFADSWRAGAQMLLRTGSTTVGDIEAVPALLPQVLASTPLRVFSFLEMTGVKSRRQPKAILAEALDKLKSLPPGRGGAGLSPHAPYSTTPELFQLVARAAHRRRLRLVIHVAESALESEMFLHRRGLMYEWLARNGRDMSDCGLGSPIQHLARHGLLGPNLVAVHVNHLEPGDAQLLGRRKVSVVHCPRSHAYFGHREFLYQELAAAGVNLCLGTDSLVTVNKARGQPMELNLFAEMRAFAAAHPAVAPEQVVRMATVNGARALGQGGQLGEIKQRARADLIALPYEGPLEGAFEAVVQHPGEVATALIDGQWAVPPAP